MAYHLLFDIPTTQTERNTSESLLAGHKKTGPCKQAAESGKMIFQSVLLPFPQWEALPFPATPYRPVCHSMICHRTEGSGSIFIITAYKEPLWKSRYTYRENTS